MSADRPHDVSYELGGINKQLEAITRTLSEDRTASAQYRTDIRKEIATQTAAISAVQTDVLMAKSDIADMKPKVESLNERALMSKGAQNFAILLSRFAHVISAGIGGIIVLLIDRYFFGRH
jgi:septal ring factor EnvC (AmiA/AmiB activator)